MASIARSIVFGSVSVLICLCGLSASADTSDTLHDRGAWTTLHHRFDDGREVCESFTGTPNSSFHVFTAATENLITLIIVHEQWKTTGEDHEQDFVLLIEGQGALSFTARMMKDAAFVSFTMGTPTADGLLAALAAGDGMTLRTARGVDIAQYSLQGSGGAMAANARCLRDIRQHDTPGPAILSLQTD